MRRWWTVVPILLAVACSNDDPVDPGVAPETPRTLTSTTLDGAVALTWSDNAYDSDPDLFLDYRVYSTSYDLDTGDCGATWSLEGTTVAPEFVVGALVNGRPKCFSVTAESVDLVESDRSNVVADTPRPDARNVVVWARQVQDAGSGFRFWDDLDGDGRVDDAELGLLLPGSSAAIDFSVERDLSGELFLTPVRAGTTVAVYGETWVDDLTSIDIAPIGGYDPAGVQALPRWGYVFQMSAGDGFARFGAVRVTHVGQDFLILDWAYQTDPGNPELVAGR